MSLREKARSALWRTLPAGFALVKSPVGAGRVALTFDDGPCELTLPLLDALDALALPATFFLMGDLSEQNPTLVREYTRRGHQIASHGYDHRRFTALSNAELRSQLQRTAQAVPQHLAAKPWVRPPYGSIDARVAWQLWRQGYVCALWSVDSGDYQAESPQKVAQCCDQVSSGDVVLLHEGHQHTIDALPGIAASLQARGLCAVTMADLWT